MQKKMVLVLVLVLVTIAIFAVTSAFAEGNARKGKRVWKKSCRLACHDGAKDGIAALSPVSKTQSQWKALMPKIKECSAKAGLKDKDVEDMFEYLHSHALDSDQPETCG